MNKKKKSMIEKIDWKEIRDLNFYLSLNLFWSTISLEKSYYKSNKVIMIDLERNSNVVSRFCLLTEGNPLPWHDLNCPVHVYTQTLWVTLTLKMEFKIIERLLGNWWRCTKNGRDKDRDASRLKSLRTGPQREFNCDLFG